MPFTPEKNSSTPIDISSMPPAPTDENIVIPPPQHRDDKHEKTTPWYRKPVALIGTGALAAAMVGGGIALSGKSRNAASQPKEPGAAAPADPTASASPAESDTPSAQPEATPTPTEAPAIDEALVSELDLMSAAEFNKLPLEKRLQWVLAKEQEINDNGYLSDFLNQKYVDDGTILGEWSPFWKALSESASGSDIVRQSTYAEQLIKGSKDDLSVDGNGPINQEFAKKMISAFAISPKTKVFKSMLDTVENTTKAGRLGDQDINDITVTHTTKNLPYVNPIDSSQTVKKTITVRHLGQTVDLTSVFIPLPVLGENNGLWLLVDQSDLR